MKSVDDSAERVTIEAEVVHAGRGRDWFGFNRAKHAVVEAAILATRFHLLPLAEVAAEFRKLRVIVGKTGGPAEHAGLLRGDLIVAIDDVEVGGMSDFMYVLETHKPGDVLLVKFLRDGQEQTTRVTLESNQVE